MKILVVDDIRAARVPLELALAAQGHEIRSATNGLEALDIFHREPVDLVVTDIQMPLCDGLCLLQRIKGEQPDVDVMMVTGYGDVGSTIEALRLGACNYLMKPVNLEELNLAVKAVQDRREMTRRLREQETRLAQARKMADLGLVASGVAHEINNPNTFIRGNIQTIQKYWTVIEPFVRLGLKAGLPAPSRLDHVLAEFPLALAAMLNGTTRIKTIVDGMAAFTRNDPGDCRAVSLNSCVQTALEAACPTIPVTTSLARDIPAVLGTTEGLTTVVLELIRNGIQALDPRTEPRLEVGTMLVDTGEVQLVVEDNGTGIKAEDRSRIFTPFYTSDPRIGRPGLGLSKVYALVRSFDGDIVVDSHEGQGTKVTVSLKPMNDRSLA